MYITAITIAIIIACTIQTIINHRERNERFYGKQYKINLIDGTYYITADRRKFQSLSERAIPAYIKNCYTTAGEILTYNDIPFEDRVAILKKRIRLTRKTLGKILFKCKLKGIIFKCDFREYEDFDIRQITQTTQEE